MLEWFHTASMTDGFKKVAYEEHIKNYKKKLLLHQKLVLIEGFN
jgi:hypothetical protein